MKFRTKYDRVIKLTCRGNEIEEVFELQVNKSGVLEPVKVGEIDVRQEINSHRDSVDLNMLIARYNAGDYEALNRRAASYFDATEMPKTLADAYRMSENGKVIFEKMPVEIKERFNNDYGQFLNQIGTKSFFDAFAPAKKETEQKVEVKDEQKSE